MYDDRKLIVFIEGIEQEYGAWELLRLFFAVEQIQFIEAGQVPDMPENSLLLTLHVEEDAQKWTAIARLHTNLMSNKSMDDYLNASVQPAYMAKIEVTQEEMQKPGKTLYKSRKVLSGTALYNVLTQFCGKSLPYGSLTGVRPAKLATMCLEDGLNSDETQNLLEKVSGMTPQKAKLLTDVALAEYQYLNDDDSVSLYIGIPFCATRCLYCSFTAYPIDRFKGLMEPYLAALEKELMAGAQLLSQMGKRVSTLYIGGGTPTALDESELKRLLGFVKSTFGSLNLKEYTVEAGRPDTLNREKLEIILQSGATRISINPQTMNDSTLKIIGRKHTPSDIQDKYQMAREVGFDNINMDIIAGLPGEDLDMFRHTLDCIAQMKPESLTVHTMAIKRASRLKEELTQYQATDDTIVAQMIELARENAYQLGMKPYYLYRQKDILANLENTGYALPGLECLYNIQTMEEKQSIMAFGAGAVSKFVLPEENRIERAFNVKEVKQYIERIDEMIDRKRKTFLSN